MSRLNRYAAFFGFFVAGFILAQVWDMTYRKLLKSIYLADYGEHVFLCDNAMRQHFIAKSRVVNEPSKANVNSLQSAEVGLLDCHEYDKFRKSLISLGLNENDLSEMGLKAIESSRTDLSTLVKQHEIRY